MIQTYTQVEEPAHTPLLNSNISISRPLNGIEQT